MNAVLMLSLKPQNLKDCFTNSLDPISQSSKNTAYDGPGNLLKWVDNNTNASALYDCNTAVHSTTAFTYS